MLVSCLLFHCLLGRSAALSVLCTAMPAAMLHVLSAKCKSLSLYRQQAASLKEQATATSM